MKNAIPIRVKTAVELKPGETGIISRFGEPALSLKLMEMGCLPGTSIRMLFSAPFGDPIAYEVAGYRLSLRWDEAIAIFLETQ